MIDFFVRNYNTFINYVSEPKNLLIDDRLNWSLGFLIIFAAIGIAYDIAMKHYKKSHVLHRIHFMFAGAGVAMLCLFWQAYRNAANLTIRLIDSVVSTFKSFGFEYTSTEIAEMIFGKNVPIRTADRLYISFVSIFAIVVTVFAALSIFKDTAAQLRYYFRFLFKSHIFSELNEKSICVAKDIRNKNKRATIVFTGVDRIGSDEALQGLTCDAETINAIMTRKSVLDFHGMFNLFPTFYLIDLEETNNIKNSIELFGKYHKKKCRLNVFSTLESAETFIDAVEKKPEDKAELNLVNRAQIIAYDLMMRYPMYRAADRCGSKTMSVLIVGAGTIGMECAKAAMWCGKMNSYNSRIRIFDSVDRKSEFDARYINFKSELDAAGVDNDFFEFHTVDINSSEFYNKLIHCLDANYIIVATGSDEMNIITATKIRRFFIRNKIKDGIKYDADKEPMIIPIISNSDYYGIFDKIAFKSDTFCPYGSHYNIYNYDTVDKWPVDSLAKMVHEQYIEIAKERKKTDPDQFIPDAYDKINQTDKRSNRANAVHIIYKLRDAGIELCRSSDEKTAKFLKRQGFVKLRDKNDFRLLLDLKNGGGKTRFDSLVELEHNRWSVFNILDGWSTWSIEQIKHTYDKEKRGPWKHKLNEALLHGSLVRTADLEKIGRELKNDKSDFFIVYDQDLTKIAKNDFVDFVDNVLKEKHGDSGESINIYVPYADFCTVLPQILKNQKNDADEQ